MITCHQCKGEKKVRCEINTIEGNTKKVEYMDLTCPSCDGKGEITAERAALLKSIDEMWCKCGNPTNNVSHHPDAPGSKHHWTCDDCGGVVQVG